MGKSPDAFRTISEAAGELDLPQHVLRFWETRFAQIKPLKRGGGRRYYRPNDVLLLKGIRHLLYDQGFTIKGVQRILREEGPGYAISIGEAGSLEAMDLAKNQLPFPVVRELAEAPEGAASETDAPTLFSGMEPDPDIVEAPMAQTQTAQTRTATGISPQGRQKLTEVMRELLECKRLLDNSRKG
ncbi:Transcriptional regulator PA2737, MerR family [hydrothermal vent metagenome]|uniref:Transcriptional regulator PA2737, MerR family n=1 Tax=hydrothermal vent metagenome TaxID=652676 RepID=A0A3B0UL65_9ZZZZ